MIHKTRYANAPKKPRRGMIPQAPQTHMAIPIDCPGMGSMFGIFLVLNSLLNDLANPVTTKKCHTKLTKGTNRSHSIPGSIVIDAGEHLVSALERVRM
jgi:hypothetical protein